MTSFKKTMKTLGAVMRHQAGFPYRQESNSKNNYLSHKYPQ
jgi:hypothetical protein